MSISTTNIILVASKIIFMISSEWKLGIENYTANSQLPRNAVKPALPSLKKKIYASQKLLSGKAS